MKKIKLNIKQSKQNYKIIIGSNIVSNFSKFIKMSNLKITKYFFVVDKNVPNKMIQTLHNSLNGEKKTTYYINANEKNKVQRTVDKILVLMLKKKFSRNDCLVAVGGGITGDIAAYTASIYKRGINFINVPTTLLSQVDSSIGGKTGINTKNGKNLIGTFYQPKIVISDTNFLKSLKKREIICGYAEILKHSIIANKKFYLYLNKNVKKILNLQSPYLEKAILESCKIKKNIVEKDEKEIGLRKTLNFGHTFAHAYEATLKYSKRLNHGEAVILGINSALNFSYKKKLIKKKNYLRILNHIKNSNLPNNLSKYFTLKDVSKIVSYMVNDKKNKSNKKNLILLKNIGIPLINKNFTQKNLNLFIRNELANYNLN